MRFEERYENNATCKLVSYTMNNDHGVVTRATVNWQKIGSQGRRLRVASGATAPGPALEGAPRFRPMSLSSCILR